MRFCIFWCNEERDEPDYTPAIGAHGCLHGGCQDGKVHAVGPQ